MITDEYDFKYESGYGTQGLKDDFITGYNNLAYRHQELGHITPYNIRIEFDYKIR